MLNKIIGLSIIVLAAGCKQVPMLPTLMPHQIDIRQGNYVTQEMIDKLKPGMTQKEVRFHLGTPLIVDPFRTDRWDYVYTFKQKGDLVEQRKLAVIFKDEKLVRLDGDVVPSKPKPEPAAPQAKPEAKPDAANADVAKPAAKPEAAAPKSAADKPAEERGFFGRLLDRIGF